MTSHYLTGHPPGTYQLRVEKHLDQHWSEWFGNLVLNQEEDGTTTLTGVVADQAELHGLLAKIRDLGLTLISVALIDPGRGSDSRRAASDQHEDVDHLDTSTPDR